MKRYLVFAYVQYYPRGGMNDFSGDYDDLESVEFKERIEWLRKSFEYIHVWDTQRNEEVMWT